MAADTYLANQMELGRYEQWLSVDSYKINNALRIYRDDKPTYRAITNEPIDEYIAILARSYRKGCDLYRSLYVILAARDERIPQLREESKKPWLSRKLHLACLLQQAPGCRE